MLRSAAALACAVIISACAATVTPEPARAAFETQATSAWLYDVETDTVLYEKNANIPKPPASMSNCAVTCGRWWIGCAPTASRSF